MRREDFRPSSAPCGVGQAGAGPRHLLSPPIALPASTGVPDLHQAALRSLGLTQDAGERPGVGDGSAPLAPAPRGYSQGASANGWPPGGGLDKCSEVSRCFRGQRAELLVTAPAPHQLSRPCLPRERRCVCLSIMLPEGNARPHPLLAPPQPAHGWCPAPLSLWAAALVAGAYGIVSERSLRSLHGQARVLGESLPVPDACLHEASTNRSPFFVVI